MQLSEALNIISRGPGAANESLTIGLVTGFTPLHLRSLLHASLQLVFPQHKIEIVTGLYGDIPGTLKEFKSKQLDAVALVVEWEDLDSRLGIRQLGGWGLHSADDIVKQSGLRLRLLHLLLQELSGSVPVSVSLPTLPLPPLFSPASWESSTAELELREKLASFATSLSRERSIRLVSEQELSLGSALAERLDVKSTWMTGFPYRLAHASSLAELLARLIHNRPAKKGLITDLDHTLWNGIVGEQGVAGINWDLDHHSQAHGLYQQMLQTLSQEGVLVAAVSKSDPMIVDELFRRDDLLFSIDRISVLDVGWGSKANAVARVLAAWNVGPDSVIFIDDSPLELAEVKAAYPDLECICFPRGDSLAVYQLLVRLRDLFGKAVISEEDELRAESIRNSAPIRMSADDSQGFSDMLLEQADAVVTLNFDKDAEDARALTLINKTNQFNLNGKRTTEAAWRRYLQQENSFLLTASYRDKYGALGKIAVLAGHVDGQSLCVDLWVMSCRALARRIEHQCLSALFDRLKSNHILFDYVATSRNAPLARFLAEVSGQALNSAVSVSLDRFQAVCPKLYHQIVVLNNE
jgi:FkbH-like protein